VGGFSQLGPCVTHSLRKTSGEKKKKNQVKGHKKKAALIIVLNPGLERGNLFAEYVAAEIPGIVRVILKRKTTSQFYIKTLAVSITSKGRGRRLIKNAPFISVQNARKSGRSRLFSGSN